jgi:hypothetical protein
LAVVTRIFLLSFVAGVALLLIAAALFPLPVHERFASRIEVLTNGGRAETFVIRWPGDRLVLDGELPGALVNRDDGVVALAPAGKAPAGAEAFRLRDVNGQVIGLATRVTATMPGDRGRNASITNWTLLIPSRGALLMSQENGADVGPVRVGGAWLAAVDAPGFWATGSRYRISAGPAAGGRGRVLGGTGEFASLRGDYGEVWELEELAANQRSEGTIQLSTVLVRAR